jgi:hypothetical protein
MLQEQRFDAHILYQARVVTSELKRGAQRGDAGEIEEL